MTLIRKREVKWCGAVAALLAVGLASSLATAADKPQAEGKAAKSAEKPQAEGKTGAKPADSAAAGSVAHTDAPTDEADSKAGKGEATPASAEKSAAGGADGAKAGDKATAASAKESADPSSPIEYEGETYYFVGLRYRWVLLPKFMISAFIDGGRDVRAPVIGPEFGVRKDDFEFNFSIAYADYGMGDTPFRAKSDPIEAYEIVQSKLNMLYFTTDFLWSYEVVPQFAINYGLGVGLAAVWGDLNRVQAAPEGGAANEGDPNAYRRCIAPGQPGTTSSGGGAFCGGDNDHYGSFSEKSWANGGSLPMVFPWLALQTGLRYKPHRNIVGRFDMGFGTSGFFLGIGADYGL